MFCFFVQSVAQLFKTEIGVEILISDFTVDKHQFFKRQLANI